MTADNRERLIASARANFTEGGYAAASMDEITAAVGLTRGALYHGFGSKEGLLRAVVDRIDTEMLERMHQARDDAPTAWDALMAEHVAYIEMAQEPDIRRIMLLDGPAVLGDPSTWPNQTECLRSATASVAALVEDGTLAPVDPEAAARLLNGAALNAALWIAASQNPSAVLERALATFTRLAKGLLNDA